MFALIETKQNNRICQVEAKTFIVHKDLVWVSCPSDCSVEWTYDGTNFHKPIDSVVDSKKEALIYLASTDWIITKITELQLEGVDVEPLKVKYADELAKRKLMREVV